MPAISSPSKTIEPLVGASMPPMRLSSVVLPEPDGPRMATNSPGLMVEFGDVQRLDLDLAHLVDLADVAHLDEVACSGHVLRHPLFILPVIPHQAIFAPPRIMLARL